MRQIRRFAERVIVALHAVERLRRSGEIARREQRRPQSIAGRVADADAFCRGAETLAQAGRLRCRQAERPYHLLGVQSQKLAAAGRGAEYAAGRSDVPAFGVVRRRHRQPDAARNLLADHQREQEVAAADHLRLGERQQRGHDRRGRVDRGRHVGIAEIEHVGARGIDEGSGQRIEPLAAPGDGSAAA